MERLPSVVISPIEFTWSPKLAYAIGLITTDGNLSKDRRHIVLRSSDLEQLENFRSCLKLSNKIGTPKVSGQYGKRVCYRIQFGDVQFYQWLLKIGLSPAKTYTLGPVNVPDEFFRDFLRGHLDGDGSISIYQDKYNTAKHADYIYLRLLVRFISASRAHIEWVRANILRLLGLKGDLFEIHSKRVSRTSIWQLKYMKKESIKLLPWLYYSQDIPCLLRKRNKAEKALALISNKKRKTYTFKRVA